MIDNTSTEPLTFTILLSEGMVCDDATKTLGERYIGAAGGDPVLAVLLACQDLILLHNCASHGLMRGRKLIINQD